MNVYDLRFIFLCLFVNVFCPVNSSKQNHPLFFKQKRNPNRNANFKNYLTEKLNHLFEYGFDHTCYPLEPEVDMNVTELLRSKGYPCEDYTVETKDGFLLSVQRIKHGRNNQNITNRPVVFLQHGLLCSSTNWVVNLVNESLAFILADEGYEVWMGNSRGNTYSRRHKSLSPDQEEFWAWSWDEMGAYDFPAMIDFALNVSGQSSLYYVGHSQGTSQAFAHLSEHPEFGEKIRIFFALAPVATVGHMRSPIRYFSALDDEILYTLLHRKDFLPNNYILDFLGDTVCNSKELRALCANVLFLIAGYDKTNLNDSRLPIYINHTPAGCSVQDLVHFVQGYRSGKFLKYDYGSAAANEMHYGQATPPEYNVSRVSTPVAMFYGANDWLADMEDVKMLINRLPNIVDKFLIPKWNHLDFIWGEDAATFVYRPIIDIIKKNSLK